MDSIIVMERTIMGDNTNPDNFNRPHDMCIAPAEGAVRVKRRGVLGGILAAAATLFLGKNTQAGADPADDIISQKEFGEWVALNGGEIMDLPADMPDWDGLDDDAIRQMVESGALQRAERIEAVPITQVALARAATVGGLYFAFIRCTNGGCVVSVYRYLGGVTYSYLYNTVLSCYPSCRWCCNY